MPRISVLTSYVCVVDFLFLRLGKPFWLVLSVFYPLTRLTNSFQSSSYCVHPAPRNTIFPRILFTPTHLTAILSHRSYPHLSLSHHLIRSSLYIPKLMYQ